MTVCGMLYTWITILLWVTIRCSFRSPPLYMFPNSNSKVYPSMKLRLVSQTSTMSVCTSTVILMRSGCLGHVSGVYV
eukprot:7394999-Heterocapsa_arctica.AAC.1